MSKLISAPAPSRNLAPSHSSAPANRREFLKQSLLALAVIPAIGSILSACNSSSDTPPNGEQAVKESDPIPTSLGYKSETSKVDDEKFPKHKGEGAKQNCKSCQFYTAKADSGWGACQILRDGDVKETGWCNTWAAKTAG